MSEPFLAEIKVVSFNFAPRGWAMCNGQLLPINQNQALFSLLGTTYGGNGQTTFALPNLRGRTPFHFGSSIQLGQAAGEEAHTLTASELPQHGHVVSATSGNANSVSPTGRAYARATERIYTAYSGATATPMAAQSLGSVGGSQPHENMPPFLVLNFIIALQGIFPSQN